MTFYKRIYKDKNDFLNAKHKQILFFGMSGLGKSYMSNMLRFQPNSQWFHYNVDYRIGTKYMGEHINDNLKLEAMKNSFLRQLLCSDSIFIASNITFNNLSPLSAYLGKPGDPAKGGMDFQQYLYRQRLHKQAEINSMLDMEYFINRARKLYNYPHFVCDSSGSLVEVVDPDNPDDLVLKEISKHCLLVWLKGDEKHSEMLLERFSRAPKPMYYREELLCELWDQYLCSNKLKEYEVCPDEFMILGYRALLRDRQPRYQSLADNWGITVEANDIQDIKDSTNLMSLIGDQL